MEKRNFFIVIFAFLLVVNLWIVLGQEGDIITNKLIIIKFIPTEFKVGDAQFSIQVQNKDNVSMTNLFAIVTGNGFSTYNIIPIDNLNPEEKDYIFISGNFKDSGEINLTININNYLFYQKVNVIGNNSDLGNKQEENELLLQNLTTELNNLKENFSALEDELILKKEDYDVSIVNLNDLNTYIKNTQISILVKDVDGAKLNLNLAIDEYKTQKKKLDNAPEISWIKKSKEKALIFSTIAGAIITLFALSELLKRKQENIVTKIKKYKGKRKR